MICRLLPGGNLPVCVGKALKFLRELGRQLVILSGVCHGKIMVNMITMCVRNGKRLVHILENRDRDWSRMSLNCITV